MNVAHLCFGSAALQALGQDCRPSLTALLRIDHGVRRSIPDVPDKICRILIYLNLLLRYVSNRLFSN